MSTTGDWFWAGVHAGAAFVGFLLAFVVTLLVIYALFIGAVWVGFKIKDRL